jgi:hypothetical protein
MISAFDTTGHMAEPWAEAGFECYCIDLQGGRTRQFGAGTIHHVAADMRDWLPPREIVDRVQFFAAFPPCDHLSVSGARWFAGKGLGKLSQAIDLFHRAATWAEWFGVPYLIENPVSTISSYWRKPDHTFHPHHFTGWAREDNYTKKTCLWTGGGFQMPDQFIADDAAAPDDRIHKAPPGPQRANFRSATPLGFARAVFHKNGNGQP